MGLPETLPGRLLASFLSESPTSPRLTWYGADGERVELSGRVLANWVTKAANLLVEEADAGPGTRVVLDLPVHWRTLVWALGSWAAGATVILPGEDGLTDDETEPPDVVVTNRPGEAPREEAAELVLAVALPALALRWSGADLPAEVVDAAAELMSYGDDLGYVGEPEPADLALVTEDVEVTYADLPSWSSPAGGQSAADHAPDDDEPETPPAVRALVMPPDSEVLVEQALMVWRGGGSVVLVQRGTPSERLEQITAEEQATPL